MYSIDSNNELHNINSPHDIHRPPPHIELSFNPNPDDESRHGVMSAALSEFVSNRGISHIHKFLFMMANYCAQQSNMHELARIKFRRYNYWLSIPAILLSTMSGSVSLASSMNKDSCDVEKMHFWISVVCGLAGLCSAAILSVHRFAAYSENEHLHGHYVDSFEKQNLDIRSNLLLHVDDQNKTFTNLYEYLKHIKHEIGLLIEKSPPVPYSVLQCYKKKKNVMIDIKEIFSTVY